MYLLIVYTLAPMYLHKEYFKAEVYTVYYLGTWTLREKMKL